MPWTTTPFNMLWKIKQFCNIYTFNYLVKTMPNNILSSTQIEDKVCSVESDRVQELFAKRCYVTPDKIPVLEEGWYQCEIVPSIISSVKENPCDPIRWNPTALVEKFCTFVGSTTGSFNTTTPHWDSTTAPITETIPWDSTTSAEDPDNDTNIIKLIGGTAIAVFTIGGMIYTGYQCFKRSKNTSKNTATTELELNPIEKDIESASPLLPTLEESNTPTELHYDIPKSNRPVTVIYEEIGPKTETSNLLDAAQKVSNRVNSLLDKLNLDEREQLNKLMNIVTSPNDHTVPSNEPVLLGDDMIYETVNEIV